METEESGPGRGFLLGLGGIGILVAVLVAAALVVPLQPGLPSGCGTCTETGGPEIVIPLGTGSNTNLNYQPAVSVVIIGQNNTVTFVNRDTVTHTVTALDKSFDSGDIKAGETWTHTFSTPGNYSYVCIYHSYMKGTIEVMASGGGATGVRVVIPPGTGSNVQQSYQPADIVLVIGVNNTVTWVNNDGVPHTVTATDSSFDSGNLPPGATWSHTFNSAGQFPYVCSYHYWMKGTVTVEAKA
jgi:plastocyanin